MNKKIKYAILSAVILLVAGFLIYHFYTTSTGKVEKDGITYELSRNAATIVDGKNATKENYVFKTIRNRKITVVSEGAFSGNQVIKKVEMYYVSYIHVNAFTNTKIESFDASKATNNNSYDKKLVIMPGAFKGSSNLKDVKLPKTLLQNDIFANCGEFSLELPDDSYMHSFGHESILYCNSPFRNSIL